VKLLIYVFQDYSTQSYLDKLAGQEKLVTQTKKLHYIGWPKNYPEKQNIHED
jgi:hypothetical protein